MTHSVFRNIIHLALAVIAAALLLNPSLHAAPPDAPLNGVHRIVFLGDSITYSGEYVDDFEAALRATPGGNSIEILDLGLPSETASGLSEPGHAGGQFPRPDLHERLDRILEKTRPDLVFACYGMNDGIYYPLGEERFQKFREGIIWLHEKVVKSGARIIHVTPPVFDPLPIKGKTLPAGREVYRQPYEGYNDVLDHYSAWLLSQRTNGWTVIDAHTPMNHYLAEHRRASPDFILARDGVHINATGHVIVAEQLIRELHLPMPTDSAGNAELLKLIHEKNRTLSDAWLTNIGHKRPGMSHGLPLADAQAKAAELNRRIEEKMKGQK